MKCNSNAFACAFSAFVGAMSGMLVGAWMVAQIVRLL